MTRGNGHMTSSDSLPLLATAASVSTSSEMSSRCSSSLSLDALSTMTAVTSFIDDDQELTDLPSSMPLSSPVEDLAMPGKLNVQNLIVISSDPSPEVNRKLRP